MRGFALLGVLVLLATASAARPCDEGGIVWGILESRGFAYIPFPVPVPTPGWHLATGVYYDERANWNFGFLGCPSALICGDGTWLYLETNGIAGLQKGGPPDVPATAYTFDEFTECQSAEPDELVVGLHHLSR